MSAGFVACTEDLMRPAHCLLDGFSEIQLFLETMNSLLLSCIDFEPHQIRWMLEVHAHLSGRVCGASSGPECYHTPRGHPPLTT